MKSLLTLFKMLSLLIAIVAVSLSASAQNGPLETINALKLTSLAAYEGQMVTAIYGAGTQSFITTAPNQINFFRVREQSAPVKIVKGQVQFPAVQVRRDGITVAFNLIAFVVHKQPTFMWTNADGTRPDGAKNGDPKFTYIFGFTKIEYMSAMTAQNNPEVLTVTKN